MHNLNIFMLLILSSTLTAQLVINPPVLELIAADPIDEISYQFQVINKSDSIVNAYWTYEKGSNYPENWTTTLWDQNLSYVPEVFESPCAIPNTFASGDSITFHIFVRTENFEPLTGNTYGILRLYSDCEHLNEIGTTSTPTVATNDLSLVDLNIYPNPTTDEIQIKNDSDISTVSIYNIVGRQVSQLSHMTGETHDVSALRAGIYFISLKNKKGNVVKAMKLYKR